jgi:uncharacterized phage infection (PIP) family protein YhgE
MTTEHTVDVKAETLSDHQSNDPSDEQSLPDPDVVDESSADEIQSLNATIAELKRAFQASQQREAQLEEQTTNLIAEIDSLKAQVKDLSNQVNRTAQLETELDDAKRYILQLTAPSAETASASATPLDLPDSPAKVQPQPESQATSQFASTASASQEVSQPTQPPAQPALTEPSSRQNPASSGDPLALRRRPVQSRKLPKMSAEQLNGLPKMSTERLTRSPIQLKTPQPKVVRPESKASPTKVDSTVPKPKLSDSEIGWFD